MIEVGLLLIITAWIFQYLAMRGKNQRIKKEFVIIYIFGVISLIFDGLSTGSIFSAALNAGAALVALAVFIKLK